MSTIRETDVYVAPDTFENGRTLSQGVRLELHAIEGDNEWVRVKAGGIEGWVRARDVKLELGSFVAGYKLHFMGGLPVSEEEFRARAGMTWEEAKELVFETKEQAKAFGDSLAAEGLLRLEDATGLYYWIWFVFDDKIHGLHPSWSGGGESLGRAECPVCGEVLVKDRKPGKHIKRVRDCIYYKDLLPPDGKQAQELSLLEIYQCVNGHLVVVQKIPCD